MLLTVMKKGEFICQNTKVMANDQAEETFMTQTGEDQLEFELKKALGDDLCFFIQQLMFIF